MDVDNDSCKTFEFVVCGIAMGIMCIFGIGGNIASFIVLWKHKVQTAIILVFQCLAFSDTLLLIMSMFVYTVPVIRGYTEHLEVTDANDFIKIYVWPFAMMSHTCTVWLTIVVTLHRFLCICKPLGIYVRYNMQLIRIQILAVVSFSITFNIPRFFEHHTIRHGHRDDTSMTMAVGNVSGEHLQAADWNNKSTYLNLGDHLFYQLIYSNIIYFPVMYIVPLMSLIYLSCRLSHAVRELEQRKTRQRVPVRQTCTPKDHITLCIIVIVVVFLLCQTPALINQIFWAALDNTERECGKFHFYFTKICDFLVIANSSVNFIIYCLFGKSFRKIFIDAFCQNYCIQFLKAKGSNICNKTAEEQETVIPLQTLQSNNLKSVT